jgi:hypothetical protein
MPFVAKDIPPKVTRSVVIQLKGPKYKEQIKRLNKELKKVARKYGARFKKRKKT